MSPPSSIPTSYELIEDESDQPPHHIIHRNSRGNHSSPTQNNRSIEITSRTTRPTTSNKPESKGEEPTQEPKILQRAVGRVCGKHALGTDDTPYDTCVEEDFAAGAGEVGGLFWSTDACDVCEGPLEDTDLNEAGPHCCDELAEEEGSWWDFHVVAHFLVGSVGEALRHGDVA